MAQRWTSLWPAVLSLGVAGCVWAPAQGHSGATDADPEGEPSDPTANETPDVHEQTGDTGDTRTPTESEESTNRRRYQGEMDVTYTYDGSFGEFSDECDGSAFVFVLVDEDTVEGEGICENEFLTFGFVIEGSFDGDALEGILIAESSLGRAETPFEGEWNSEVVRLAFDHTHAADGESLRLEGVINLVPDE